MTAPSHPGAARGRWWGLSGLLAAVLLLFLGGSLLRVVRRDEIDDPAELDAVYRAAGAAAERDIQAGRKPVTFPVEMRVASSREYFDLLASHGYVSERDRKRLDAFVVANVSASDPAETAFLISRSYYAAWKDRRPAPAHYIVLLKYGQACVASGGGVPLRLPKREPKLLEP